MEFQVFNHKLGPGNYDVKSFLDNNKSLSYSMMGKRSSTALEKNRTPGISNLLKI